MSALGFPEQIGMKQFEADRNAAEGVRQNTIATAIAAGGALVGEKVKAAEIAYYRRVIASAQLNGIQNSGFQQALRDLGAA